MSRQPQIHRPPSRFVETLTGVNNVLRSDPALMMIFRDARAVFTALCGQHHLDPNTTWDALTIVEMRCRQGIDPMDGRPGWEIKAEHDQSNVTS